jgi:hypothetical protein
MVFYSVETGHINSKDIFLGLVSLMVTLEWNPNKIRINREKYLKHTVTDLEATNEPSSYEFPILGNYSLDSDFGNFIAMTYEISVTQKS